MTKNFQVAARSLHPSAVLTRRNFRGRCEFGVQQAAMHVLALCSVFRCWLLASCHRTLDSHLDMALLTCGSPDPHSLQ